jgi:hypothetical protein
MLAELLMAFALAGEISALPYQAPNQAPDQAPAVALVLHTYEVKFRLDSRVSTTQVQANDGGHAKKLVQAQYGPKVTVLSVKKVD